MTEEQLEQFQKLKAVARWILRPDQRGPVFDNLGDSSIDGGDIQDLYVKLGILLPITVTEPCGEACECMEWDDFPQTCYVFADWMKEEKGG